MIVIRRNDDSDDSPSPSSISTYNDVIIVSRKSLYLSEKTTQSMTVSWKIRDAANMMDWIGLFDSECRDLSQFLDHRGRGVVGSRHGTVAWNLSVATLPSTVKRIFFAYIDGLTGRVVARSPDVFLTQRACLRIKEINFHGSQEPPSVLFSIGSNSFSTDTEKQRDTVLPFVDSSTLLVEYSESRLRIPLTDIEALSKDLSIALPTVHKNAFTLQVTVAVEPESGPEMLDSSEWLSAAVSPSSSGSSMSQSSSTGSSSSTSHIALENLPPLPKGWEACVDRTGRTFYIDHVTKRTTWHRPGMKIRDETIATKRYSMARRTVGLGPPPFCSSPAQLFLQREDFISILHDNPTALSVYNASPLLKHMLHRIRKCGDACEKFEAQRDFISFVNLFADTTQPLPPNWSASATKPVVFIDHGNRRTTLLDPRLPTTALPERKRGRSAPPVRRQPVDKNGNMLDIVHRTEEIATLVEKRLPELAPKIRKKLRLIERLGHLALNRMANDVDLIMAISILDAEDPATVSELEEKLNHFYASLQRSGYGCGPQKLKLRFSRSQLLRDAFDQILAIDAGLLKKAKLTISFDDEEGLDYGGPSRELFFLLSRELFNPYYGLFEYTAADKYTVQVNADSAIVDNHIQWFELSGRILGLALLHRCLIDTFFSPIFYKTLLELPIDIDDFAEQDPEFYRSLVWLRSHNVDESLGMTFVATHKVNGEIVEKELLPAGADLHVTDVNKEEFISLMVKWRAEREVQRQTRALLRGLHQIVDRDFLRVFTPDQLELVLSGSVEINLDDWRSNTEYRGGYHDEHVVVEWFWDTVEQMSNADRLKLLQFVTGTASVPFEGFSMLRGSSGLKRFTIEKWGEEYSLPRAHTCFNRIDLPSYPTRHILRAKLFTAINEGINYAIE